jgi:hypothetical protein
MGHVFNLQISQPRSQVLANFSHACNHNDNPADVWIVYVAIHNANINAMWCGIIAAY